MPLPVLLRLDRIITNGGTQPRAAMHEETIADYAEAMEAGAKFPPVTVFFDGEKHWLADGFHRVAGAKRAGFLDVDADVRQGSKRDAILFSLGANAAHGLRRTNEDKRRVVKHMLEDWSEWSTRKIADACGVSHFFVNKLRPTHQGGASGIGFQIEPADEPPEPVTRTVQRGDAVYEMDVSGGARTKPSKPSKAPEADPDAVLEKDIAHAEGESGVVVVTELDQFRAELASVRE
jgi:hypothetical protein